MTEKYMAKYSEYAAG